MNPPPSIEKPTSVRYGVLGFACVLSMITYLDRVCFASAVPAMVRELGLNSAADLKWAMMAFALAYAAFEIPSGWLGDVYGPRNVLIRIVLWWSFFTALTGFIGLSVVGLTIGLLELVVIRFLFGMGEAGAYPNITRALHNWLPFRERGLGQGAVWMAGRLMGGLTPLTWALLVEQGDMSWRAAFYIFGGIGIIWCLWFAIWFRNRPDQKPEVNQAEMELIMRGRPDLETGHAGVPWLKILASGNLWILCLMYFCAAYGWYFNITFLPSFLEEQHDVDPKSLVGAVYKGGPLWLGAIACLGGGFLTDWFVRRSGNLRWGRRLFGILGHSLCGLCYLACLATDSAFTFFLTISFAAFFNDLIMGPAWAVCQDIGKKYAAIIAGFMNTIGNLGGFTAAWVTGTILQSTLADHADSLDKAVDKLTAAEKAVGNLPGYQISFVIFAGVYFLAVAFWLRIDATKPVAPEEEGGGLALGHAKLLTPEEQTGIQPAPFVTGVQPPSPPPTGIKPGEPG